MSDQGDEDFLEVGDMKQEALRLRDEALRARDDVEKRCNRLELELQQMLTTATEANLEAEQIREKLQRLEHEARKKEQAHEEDYERLISQKSELHEMVNSKSEQLVRSNALSRQLDMSYTKLKRTHQEVLLENERAKEVLALERTVVHYKQRKEKECKDWDARLQKAQLECEQRLQSLTTTWEARTKKYNFETSQLQAQYDELQSKYELKRTRAERELDYQIHLKRKALEEAETDAEKKIEDLSEDLQRRTEDLRAQLLQNAKTVHETSENARQQMHTQAEEIQRECKLRTERERAETSKALRVENEKILFAKEDYATWQGRVRELEHRYAGRGAAKNAPVGAQNLVYPGEVVGRLGA